MMERWNLGTGGSTMGELIVLRHLHKTYRSEAGSFTALREINLEVKAGEFVAIIGKSGSGKSTLLNMVTGIDRPTSGEVLVGGLPVHTLSEGRLARWRGRNVGVVFQFFQLIPTLTLVENVMLPMDFCGVYAPRARQGRALALLEQVGMAAHAQKLPGAVSGGQQQLTAIARALANDPPILVADEPTGSLDSQTAESVYQIFERLTAGGKTVLMVTHDHDLARRVQRTVIMTDGEVISQQMVQALPGLGPDLLMQIRARLRTERFAPGTVIIREGEEADHAYIITAGSAEVLVEHPTGRTITVSRLGPGQMFGEVALITDSKRAATVRACAGEPVELLVIDRETFAALLSESAAAREQIDRLAGERRQQLAAAKEGRPPC